MEIFSSLRENRDNSADTIRCILDSLGIIFIIPAASITSIKCKDFNKKEYSVNFSNNLLMKTTLIKITIIITSFFLVGCAKKYVDIKSPCVSTYSKNQQDPCGPRRPINCGFIKIITFTIHNVIFR